MIEAMTWLLPTGILTRWRIWPESVNYKESERPLTIWNSRGSVGELFLRRRGSMLLATTCSMRCRDLAGRRFTLREKYSKIYSTKQMF